MNSKIISFNCLCCDNTVTVESLAKVPESEHICKSCKDLSVTEFVFVLAARRAKTIHS